MFQNEVKGQLAKLLATENLIIEHKVCETASFNVETRTLILPIWEVGDRTYTMLVGHEVGHALYTPNDDSLDNLPCPKSYVNVTEDARIEKLMKRKFPGLTKDFYAGYQDLHSRDFFSVKDEDLSTMKLIDRINLYYKVGAHLMLPFDASETPLCDAVGAAETFEEAIAAALAIFEFEKQKREQEQHLAPLSNKDTGDTSIEKSEGKSDEQAQDVSDESDQPGEEESDNGGEEYPDGGAPMDDLESDTDASLTENLKDVTNQWKSNETHYLTVNTPDLDYHIVSTQRMIDMAEEYWDEVDGSDIIKTDWSYVDNEYRKFKRECAREVNYLAKEFELKKSAAAYSRESISRTGVLDTKKLHTYKFNEDLFKKVTVRPDGKNHGLIFLLDWSGSMAEVIHDTYKQLLSLCFFCRKAGIPFSVFAFVNDASYGDIRDYDEHVGKENTFYIGKHFHLLEFLNGDLSNSVFDRYARNLFRVTQMYEQRYGNRNPFLERPVPDAVPGHLMLGGTPLNEAIMSLQTIIPQFSTKHSVEKCHVTILSDGESNWSGYWTKSSYDDEIHRSAMAPNTAIRCRKTGRTYNLPKWGNYMTESILRYMKGRFPQCNFTGFRLGSARDIGYIINNFNDLTQAQKNACSAVFKKQKATSAPIMGYQELFLIQSNKLNDDVEFEVQEDATKAQITRAFKKTLNAKANNKRILSSFITQIA